jgi:hypothetical protein
MAKKAPAKPPAKRKPAAKKAPAIAVEPSKPIAWRSWLVSGAKAAALIVCGAVAGIWGAGGIEIGPEPVPADSVSAVFDTQESTFRSLSGERAEALRAGEIKSEADSAAWMSSRFIPAANNGRLKKKRRGSRGTCDDTCSADTNRS